MAAQFWKQMITPLFFRLLHSCKGNDFDGLIDITKPLHYFQQFSMAHTLSNTDFIVKGSQGWQGSYLEYRIFCEFDHIYSPQLKVLQKSIFFQIDTLGLFSELIWVRKLG